MSLFSKDLCSYVRHPTTVFRFKQAGLFRNRCTISTGGAVLAEYTQPWNALILTIVFAIWGLVLLSVVSRLLWNRM
jgi:hypothetical protein